MIEPGKNGRRSGSVAKGRCEAGCVAKNGRPLARWILRHIRVAEASLEDAREKPQSGAHRAVAGKLLGFVWGWPGVVCPAEEGTSRREARQGDCLEHPALAWGEYPANDATGFSRQNLGNSPLTTHLPPALNWSVSTQRWKWRLFRRTATFTSSPKGELQWRTL